MPISGSDLHWYLSSSGASEGGAMSATEIVNGVDNNVFPDVSDSSRIAGGSMIRKVFVVNEHATDNFMTHSIYVKNAPTNATPALGLGFDDADDDDGAVGTLAAFTSGAKVALVSDGSDTRSVDVWGVSGGVGVLETIVLTGNSEVLSIATFAIVYAVHTTVSGSRTVSIRQGSAGAVRGTIGVGAVNCFGWIAAASKSVGILLPESTPSTGEGIWEKVTWAALAPAVYGNVFALQAEEI